MIEYRTKIGKVIVGCWLNGKEGNIILASGVPQYIGKYHPFLQMLSEREYNLFVPRYEGSWESDGVMTLRGCINTLRKTVRLVNKGSCRELYGNDEISWKKTNTSIIGFSFGVLPALLSKVSIKKILICPFAFPKYHLGSTQGEDIRQTLGFVAKAYGHAYRFKPSSLIGEFEKVKYPKHISGQTVVIRGAYDESIPAIEVDELSRKYHAKLYVSNTGHTIVIEKDVLFKALELNEGA